MKVQEALKAAIEELEAQGIFSTANLCKSALSDIEKCEPVINLNILKYTEHGVIPDDFKGQASGYRAGWNDCLSSVQYMFSQPIVKCEPVAWLRFYSYQNDMDYDEGFEIVDKYKDGAFPVYTSPISKEWIGLTDAEALKLWDDLHPDSEQRSKKDYWLAIEAKLKQLNAEKG